VWEENQLHQPAHPEDEDTENAEVLLQQCWLIELVLESANGGKGGQWTDA
jgi:hypothetical protein